MKTIALVIAGTLCLGVAWGQPATTIPTMSAADRKALMEEENQREQEIYGKKQVLNNSDHSRPHVIVTHDKFKHMTIIRLDEKWRTSESYRTYQVKDAETGDTAFDPGQLVLRDPNGKETSFTFDILATYFDNTAAATMSCLSFTSRTQNWEYLKTHDFDCLVDGKNLKTSGDKYDNQVLTGGVEETVNIFLNPDQLESLSEAKKVECRIGGRNLI